MRHALFGLLVLTWFIPTAHAQSSASDLNRELTSFYEAPSAARAAGILTAFSKSELAQNRAAHAGIAGFFAGVFTKYPADVGRIIPAKMDDLTTYTVALALRFAGQSERSTKLLKALAAKGFLKLEVIDGLPKSIDTLSPATGTDFDILWGASFATGDPRYVAKIVERYASVAKDAATADTLVAIVRANAAHQQMAWLRAKYSDEDAVNLVNTASALWSLNANGAQHPFVGNYVEQYMKAHAGEPAAKGLTCVRQPGCTTVSSIP